LANKKSLQIKIAVNDPYDAKLYLTFLSEYLECQVMCLPMVFLT